jgi:hypothetical protein
VPSAASRYAGTFSRILTTYRKKLLMIGLPVSAPLLLDLKLLRHPILLPLENPFAGEHPRRR